MTELKKTIEFTKQFPGLKELIYVSDDPGCFRMKHKGETICAGEEEAVRIDDVRAHCLDKQKVKEAIEKCNFTTSLDGDCYSTNLVVVDDLLEELGL